MKEMVLGERDDVEFEIEIKKIKIMFKILPHIDFPQLDDMILVNLNANDNGKFFSFSLIFMDLFNKGMERNTHTHRVTLSKNIKIV